MAIASRHEKARFPQEISAWDGYGTIVTNNALSTMGTEESGILGLEGEYLKFCTLSSCRPCWLLTCHFEP
jgi:hypothetical protein